MSELTALAAFIRQVITEVGIGPAGRGGTGGVRAFWTKAPIIQLDSDKINDVTAPIDPTETVRPRKGRKRRKVGS